MKTALGRMLACAIASCILATFATDSNASWFNKDKKGIADPRIAAGMFSGTLSGDIKIGSKKFQVTPNTMIYVLGEGPSEDYGMRLLRRPISVRGHLVDGVMVAEVIVVRPRTSPFSRHDSSRGIISGNNPNVGVAEKASE